MINVLSVGCSEPQLIENAKQIASRLHLPINNEALPRLHLNRDKLALLVHNFSPLYVDFQDSKWQQRSFKGKQQGLIRACKPTKGLKILDATAGWGRDAAILAHFGAQVTMIERNPIMGMLLEDALTRLGDDSALKPLLSLHNQDAISLLKNLDKNNYPDVIYMDPMHPERQKSALVKKDMQVLQQLIGYESDANELLETALSYAKKRVVVKWPQKALSLKKTSQQINGKTVRFDIYSTNIG